MTILNLIKIVGKGEIAHTEEISSFPPVFSKD